MKPASVKTRLQASRARKSTATNQHDVPETNGHNLNHSLDTQAVDREEDDFHDSSMSFSEKDDFHDSSMSFSEKDDFHDSSMSFSENDDTVERQYADKVLYAGILRDAKVVNQPSVIPGLEEHREQSSAGEK